MSQIYTYFFFCNYYVVNLRLFFLNWSMKDFIHIQFLDSDASLGTKGFCLEECMGLEIEVELCYVLVPSEKMSRKKKETVASTKRSYYTSKPGG